VEALLIADDLLFPILVRPGKAQSSVTVHRSLRHYAVDPVLALDLLCIAPRIVVVNDLGGSVKVDRV
jgi:hypothetical protein